MADTVKVFGVQDGIEDTHNVLLFPNPHSLIGAQDFLVHNGQLVSANIFDKKVSGFDEGAQGSPAHSAWVPSGLPSYIYVEHISGMPRTINGVLLDVKTGASAHGGIMSELKNIGGYTTTASPTWFSLTASMATEFYFAYSNRALDGYGSRWVFSVSGAGAPDFGGGNMVTVDAIAATSVSNYPYSTIVGSTGGTDANNTLYMRPVGSNTRLLKTVNYLNYTYGLAKNTSGAFTNRLLFFSAVESNPPVAVTVDSTSNLYDVEALAPAIMNDRTHIIAGGSYMHPHIMQAGGSAYTGASIALITMLNGTITPATGVTIYPGLLHEYKNRMHYIAPTILYSDASGPHEENYPRSIFPSQGFSPYIIDWEEEILVDSPHPITGFAEFGDMGYVFTESDVYYFNYDETGAPTAMTAFPVDAGVDKDTDICQAGNFLVWCNRFGVYATDGASINKLTKDLSSTWELFFDRTGSRRLMSYDPSLGKLFVGGYTEYSPGSGALCPTLVIDIATGKASYINKGIAAVLPGDKDNSYYLEQGNLNLRVSSIPTGFDMLSQDLLTADDAYGSVNDGNNYIEKLLSVNTDMSQNIQAVYLRISYYMYNITGTAPTMNIQARWDTAESSSWELDEAVTLSSDVASDVRTGALMTKKMLVPNMGNVLYVKISFDSSDATYDKWEHPIVIRGMQLDVDVEERRDE